MPRHVRAPAGCRPAVLVLASLLAVLAFACGDDDGGPLSIGEERIGPAGGLVEAPDGDARAVVPAGALDAETVLTVRRLSDAEVPEPLADLELLSGVYSFGPDGLAFDVPVRVELFFDDEDLPPGADLEDVTIVKLDESGDLVELSDIELLSGGRRGIALQARRGVGGQVSAFSPFAVVVDEDDPGSPPIVTRIVFPSTLPNDPGSETVGAIEFVDSDADVVRVVVEELQDPNDAFDPFAIDDPDALGKTSGTIGFRIFCPQGPSPCGTGPVVARVVLVDAAGHRSTPAPFAFEIVD